VTNTYTIRFYRVYDTGDKIDLEMLDEALAADHTTTRARFSRVNPKSITMDVPPLAIQLPPVRVDAGGTELQMAAVARLYDIGAVSICYILEGGTPDFDTLQAAALHFAGQRGLDSLYFASLETVRGILLPHLGELTVDVEFFEDYTIYWTDRLDETLDPVVILLGEEMEYSLQTRDDTLKNSLSYGTGDLTILSWDTSLLVSGEIPEDIIDLIEFANVQALELRYYDRVLTLQTERMYEDIESLGRRTQMGQLGQYRLVMARLMETYAELSEIIEKVDNLIKITEDIYYARVYATALNVLRISQWRSSVDRRIEVIRQNYMMLSDEVNVRHSNFLEIVIILLIAIELAFFIWQEFGL
jgi:hypothetical protein